MPLRRGCSLARPVGTRNGVGPPERSPIANGSNLHDISNVDPAQCGDSQGHHDVHWRDGMTGHSGGRFSPRRVNRTAGYAFSSRRSSETGRLHPRVALLTAGDVAKRSGIGFLLALCVLAGAFLVGSAAPVLAFDRTTGPPTTAGAMWLGFAEATSHADRHGQQGPVTSGSARSVATGVESSRRHPGGAETALLRAPRLGMRPLSAASSRSRMRRSFPYWPGKERPARRPFVSRGPPAPSWIRSTSGGTRPDSIF